MNSTYRNAIASHGAGLVTHIGIVNSDGNEPSGGSPAYARKAVSWTSPSNGLVRPNANIVFDMPAGFTVSAWRGFSASSGGTNYGGANLTQETFAAQGTYTLLASQTDMNHAGV